MRISAALIVRDEEATLGRCLDSIREHVDEIVVVDTGSCDGTQDVARRHRAQVFQFPWRNDFSAARQCSFDLARGDWVFWIDADDIVVNAGEIRMEIAEFGADCFYWKYEAGVDPGGDAIYEWWRERCVRNNRNFRWRGRVHEVLAPHRAVRIRRSPSVRVLHRPEERGADANPRRNLDILERERAAAGRNPAPRLLFYLANEYADAGQYDLAATCFHRYLEVSHWDEERYLALIRLAEMERLRNHFEEARFAADRAIELLPGWPQAYFSLAETCYFLQEWRQVADWCEAGAKLPAPDALCVTNTLSLRYSWIIFYTNALFRLGRLQEAREWTARALAICPGERWHMLNQQYFSTCASGEGKSS